MIQTARKRKQNYERGELNFIEQIAEERAATEPAFAELWTEGKQEIQLAKLRKESGLTQAEIAERMGVKQPTVARIERKPSSVAFGTIRKYILAVGGQIKVMAVRESQPPKYK